MGSPMSALKIIARIALKEKVVSFLNNAAKIDKSGGDFNCASLKREASGIGMVNFVSNVGPGGLISSAARLGLATYKIKKLGEPEYVHYLCDSDIQRFSEAGEKFTRREFDSMLYKIIAWKNGHEDPRLKAALLANKCIAWSNVISAVSNSAGIEDVADEIAASVVDAIL